MHSILIPKILINLCGVLAKELVDDKGNQVVYSVVCVNGAVAPVANGELCHLVGGERQEQHDD